LMFGSVQLKIEANIVEMLRPAAMAHAHMTEECRSTKQLRTTWEMRHSVDVTEQ